MKNLIWAAGSVVVSLALAFFLLGGTGHSFGAITSPASNFDFVQLSQGLQLPAGPSVSTTAQGTQVQGIWDGTCTILASSPTIAATSTQTVDCQAGASSASALTGVTAGDRVFVQLASTTPTTSLGLRVVGASASSTPGYITMTVLNGTGAAFTWTAAASSSVQYLDLR